MVWHVCLLTTNDEHHFTCEAWVCAEGKEAEVLCDGFVRIYKLSNQAPYDQGGSHEEENE